MAYWSKIAVILDAEKEYKSDIKQLDMAGLQISMGCRWSEVQILSPRPIFDRDTDSAQILAGCGLDTTNPHFAELRTRPLKSARAVFLPAECLE
jgi:hypothetical protein